MSSYEIVGPFTKNYLTVNGRQVPFVEAWPVNGGKITLSLDSRYLIQIPVDLAETLIPWIANAIAIGLGYASHPPEAPLSDEKMAYIERRQSLGLPTRRTPFVPMHGITSVTTEPAPPEDPDPLAGLDPDSPL